MKFTGLLFTGLSLLLLAPAAAVAKPIDVVNANGVVHHFDVDVAATVQARSTGLMWRQDMKEENGMLFVFANEHIVSFWMKNVLIPLDIIYIKEDGTISKIHEMAKPQDLTPISSKGRVKYALEIGGGLSQKLQISKGDKVIFKDSLKGLEIQ